MFLTVKNLSRRDSESLIVVGSARRFVDAQVLRVIHVPLAASLRPLVLQAKVIETLKYPY